jgi:hypothetical protein
MATDVLRKRQNSANLKERWAAIGNPMARLTINIHRSENSTFLLRGEILKRGSREPWESEVGFSADRQNLLIQY